MMPLQLRHILVLVILAAPLGAQRPPDAARKPPVDTTRGSTPLRADLPRSVPVPVFAKATRTVFVAAPKNLQAALNAAQPGDSLVLSGTWTGNYVLPTRPCGAGISVVGTTRALTPGTRITPTSANGFARIITPNSAPALRTTNPTCQWRLAGLEITGTLKETSIQYGLLALGDGGWRGGGDSQTSTNRVPQGIALSHLYVHGTPTLNIQRCVALNSAATVLRDSWISECHVKGFQGQAVATWNSPGPLLIENNFIAGGGQNILFGGADPGIAGLIPSDVTVRRNHVWKDPKWKGVYGVGALIETKNVQRLLVEDNVFENTWSSLQSGMAIMFKSQTGNETGSQLWQGSTDITFRYNIVRNAQRGLNLQAVGEGGSDRPVARVTAEHNLFTGIGLANGVPATDGWLILLTHDLSDVLIAHNTFVGNAPGIGLVLSMAYSGGGARRIAIDDNVLAGQASGSSGSYAIGSDNGVHTAALTNYAGSRWSFSRNAVSQVEAQFVRLNPSTSRYVDAIAKLGLAPDYSLLPTSQFKGKGLDRTDPGANIAELTRRTMGVVVAP